MSAQSDYLQTLKQQLHDVKQALEDNQQLTEDPELKELALSEIDDLNKQKQSLEEAISSIEEGEVEESSDLPRDVILEIRSAAGGDEAGLFAGDLYRMYLQYAQNQGWKTRQLTINEGGIGDIKEVVAQIHAPSSTPPAFPLLQHESGVHRVQRIPATESSGRIHTSTVTVAVLPKVPETEIEINSSDLEIESFRSSGPGGQHANKTESAVRITHKPTNIVVTCQDSRSQLKNRRAALDILRSRLYQRRKEERENELSQKRRKQIGQGRRAEKIRTYNFPQNRITDHRINQSWYQPADILDGDLDPIVKSLRKEIDS